ESNKYRLGGSADTVSTDGGSTSYLYEQGTNLTLHPITDAGLVGYWTFDEGTGTQALDSSGNNNTGTLTNGPTWQQANNCKTGGCLSFDGVDDNVDLGTPIILRNISNGSFSLSAWMKTSDNTGRGAIIGSFGSYPCVNFEVYMTGNMRYWNGNGSSTDDLVGYAGDLRNGIWHYVTMVRDRNSSLGKIYVDGLLDRSSSISVPDGVIASNIRIGSDNRLIADITHNGFIDDVRIYNRALSAVEILSIYNATR
ncbi:MAG: LamG domain-containing protein, partial [Candidatus Paceibacterota bacterium]